MHSCDELWPLEYLESVLWWAFSKNTLIEPQISRSITAQRKLLQRPRIVECTRHNVPRLGNVPGQIAVFFVTAALFHTPQKKSKSNKHSSHKIKNDNIESKTRNPEKNELRRNKDTTISGKYNTRYVPKKEELNYTVEDNTVQFSTHPQ